MSNSYHTTFEIKVIKLGNLIDQGSDEKLFIRYYIPALGNRRIQVDTREIQYSKNSVMWNESASFESQANLDQIKQLEFGHITFELRCRRNRQIFGGIMTKSRLLGGGEISWKDVMMESNEVEKWVNFSSKSGKSDGLMKLPNLLVKMKIQVTRDVDSNAMMRKCGSKEECNWNESEIDMFHVETLVD